MKNDRKRLFHPNKNIIHIRTYIYLGDYFPYAEHPLKPQLLSKEVGFTGLRKIRASFRDVMV